MGLQVVAADDALWAIVAMYEDLVELNAHGAERAVLDDSGTPVKNDSLTDGEPEALSGYQAAGEKISIGMLMGRGHGLSSLIDFAHGDSK